MFTSARVVDRVADAAHGLVDRHAVLLRAVAEAERDGSAGTVLLAGDQLERHLLGGVRADLLLHAVVAVIELGAHALAPELGDDLAEVVGVLLGDGDADDLHRRQPHRERPGVVLEEDREEPLDRSEQRAVDHDRAASSAPSRSVYSSSNRSGRFGVDLHRGQLPGAPDRILGLEVDLRAVERGFARHLGELEPAREGDVAQRVRWSTSQNSSVPIHFVLLVVAHRQLELEVARGRSRAASR